VVVNLYGESLDDLDAKAADVAAALETVPGAEEVEVKAPSGAPRIAVRLRQADLTAFGLRPVDVLETVQVAYEGTVVAQIIATTR